jgi:putative redox protein
MTEPAPPASTDSSAPPDPRNLRHATVSLQSGMQFEGTAGSGHSLRLDANSAHGGQGGGFSPMELLLLGLGGCTGMDVIALLRKMRQDVTDYRVEVEGERREQHPQVYTRIRVVHVVRGRNLDPKAVARAVELSETRYCPASAMLAASADLHHTFRLEQAEA